MIITAEILLLEIHWRPKMEVRDQSNSGKNPDKTDSGQDFVKKSDKNEARTGHRQCFPSTSDVKTHVLIDFEGCNRFRKSKHFIHSISNFETRIGLFCNNLLIGKGSINSWFGQMTNMLIQDNAIHSYFRHDDKYKKRFYCVKTVRYELLTKLSFFFHFDRKWIVTSYLKKLGTHW